MIDKEKFQPVNVKPEEGFTWAVSAGVVTPGSEKNTPSRPPDLENLAVLKLITRRHSRWFQVLPRPVPPSSVILAMAPTARKRVVGPSWEHAWNGSGSQP